MADVEILGAVLLIFQEHKGQLRAAAWILFGVNTWIQVERILSIRQERDRSRKKKSKISNKKRTG